MDEPLLVRGLERRPCLGGVLVVALAVDGEVLDRGRVVGETVVVEQAAELRLGDRGLAGLDRVEDRGRAELVVGRGPGVRAAAGLRQRLGLLFGAKRRGEVVPERDVLRLFLGVQPRRARRACKRDDRVSVLAGVAGQLLRVSSPCSQRV